MRDILQLTVQKQPDLNYPRKGRSKDTWDCNGSIYYNRSFSLSHLATKNSLIAINHLEEIITRVVRLYPPQSKFSQTPQKGIFLDLNELCNFFHFTGESSGPTQKGEIA